MSTETGQPSQAHPGGRAYTLLIATTLFWAANAIFARLAVGEISPMLLVTLRWLGSLLLMLGFARPYLRQDWPVLRAHLPYLAVMGALGFAAFNALYYFAAHTTTAVNIGIIQGAMPMCVLIGAFIFYRLPVTILQVAGVCLTIAGVIMVASGASLARLAALTFNQGDLLMLGACVLYAGYALGLRRRPEVTSLGLFTAFAAAAFLASLPLAAAELALGTFQWPTPEGWLIVGLVIVFPSFLSQVMFMLSVAQIGPARAGVFINLVPVFAAIMGVVILGEPFQSYHALALVLVLGGIGLAEWAKKR